MVVSVCTHIQTTTYCVYVPWCYMHNPLSVSLCPLYGTAYQSLLPCIHWSLPNPSLLSYRLSVMPAGPCHTLLMAQMTALQQSSNMALSPNLLLCWAPGTCLFRLALSWVLVYHWHNVFTSTGTDYTHLPQPWNSNVSYLLSSFHTQCDDPFYVCICMYVVFNVLWMSASHIKVTFYFLCRPQH